MTPEVFARGITALEMCFNFTHTMETKRIYAIALGSKLSDQQFEQAVANLLTIFVPTSARPFPVPAEFLSSAGLDNESKGRNAIGVVKEAISRIGPYESVDFGDTALHFVIQQYGGWVALCEEDTQKFWDINERRFLEQYMSAVAAGSTGEQYLLGLGEQNCKLSGFKYPKGTVLIYRDGRGKIAAQEQLALRHAIPFGSSDDGPEPDNGSNNICFDEDGKVILKCTA